MVNRIVSAEDQIQRVNQVINKVERIQKLDPKTLLHRQDPKRWSIIEVVGHMNAAYHLYESRVEALLEKLPDLQETESEFKAGRKNAFFIKSITPRGRKRPMKLKTMKRFEPVFDVKELDEAGVNEVFQEFYRIQDHIKKSIQAGRKKKTKGYKLESAIGPIVMFHLPEAFEFIIGHEERHLVQIEEMLEG